MKKIGLIIMISLLISNLYFPTIGKAAQSPADGVGQCFVDSGESYEKLFSSDCLFQVIQAEHQSESYYLSEIMSYYSLDEEEARHLIKVYIDAWEGPIQEETTDEEIPLPLEDVQDQGESESIERDEPISDETIENPVNEEDENLPNQESVPNKDKGEEKSDSPSSEDKLLVENVEEGEKQIDSGMGDSSELDQLENGGSTIDGEENQLIGKTEDLIEEPEQEVVETEDTLNENVEKEKSGSNKNSDSHTYIPYNISLEEAVNRQHGIYAVTDTYRQFVSAQYISYNSQGNYYYVNTDVLNVRSGPSTAHAVVDRLNRDTRVTVRGNPQNGWYQLHWVRATKEDIAYYMNPNNFINDERQQFQFLDLSQSSGVTAEILNQYLEGKGTLSGQGQAFIDAGRIHGINEIYLLSHALLETGHGTSYLASGNEYNGVIVYNMYGIGAVDACPNECGLERAYNEGWDSPYKAIVGGASFIGNNYVRAGQNTLYKMRWNLDGLIENGRPTHQYATDIGWASKQVNNMYNLYQEIGSYNLILEIPKFEG